MGLDEQAENVIVPGQGLRRVTPLTLISAIGFSGLLIFIILFVYIIWYFGVHLKKVISICMPDFKKVLYIFWSLAPGSPRGPLLVSSGPF
jgi:hypothetical protein